MDRCAIISLVYGFIYSLKKKMLSSVYCKLDTMLCTEALQINLKNCIKQQHMS